MTDFFAENDFFQETDKEAGENQSGLTDTLTIAVDDHLLDESVSAPSEGIFEGTTIEF